MDDINVKIKEIMNFNPSNRIVFESLQDSIRNQRNIIPFVGAGISAFAYQTWKNLLMDFSENLDVNQKNIAKQQIENNKYLEAAQTICDGLGNTIFFAALRRFYSEDKIDDKMLMNNAAYYIPQICNGNCLTTNYDRVIEHACMLNSILYDTVGFNDTVKLNTYFRNPQKKGLIFKIHGDILSNNERILLSQHSYQTNYAEGSELRRQLERWIAGKTFLFVGTSLFNDEPIQVLTSMIEEGLVNYAIYSCSYDEKEIFRKRFDSLGILPILYNKNDHLSLVVLLKYLLS